MKTKKVFEISEPSLVIRASRVHHLSSTSSCHSRELFVYLVVAFVVCFKGSTAAAEAAAVTLVA